MYATYHLSSAQEITIDILEAIKATFKAKAITITVEEELDTTNYLLKNPANKAMLEKSMKQAQKGNFIEIGYNDL